MASTYSPNLRLELIGTGEQQGTWGATTNTNLGTLLEEAIGGYASVTVSDSGDTTLTTSNGAADQSRNATIELIGTLSATRNVICPAIEKLYVVKNSTSGGFAVTFKVSGQTGVSVPNGATVFLYVDGTDARTITGSLAMQSASNVAITGGSITGVTGIVLEPASVAQGDVLYYSGSAWARLAAGTSGQYLKTNGANANPQWAGVTGEYYSQNTTPSNASNTAVWYSGLEDMLYMYANSRWWTIGDGGAAPNINRALNAGGYNSTENRVSTINLIDISTTGNSTNFGQLTLARARPGPASSSTRGLFGGGGTGTPMSSASNVIDYVAIAIAQNATDFGDLTTTRGGVGGCSNGTRAVFAGGTLSSTKSNVIDYVTIQTVGSATDFGDLSTVRAYPAGLSNGTRGIFAGDATEDSLGEGSQANTINYITIATTGNGTNFGNLSLARAAIGSFGSTTRGVFFGGYDGSVPVVSNVIDYITIATTGNATDFGDLTTGRISPTGASNGSRGIAIGGNASASGFNAVNISNVIDYVTIDTTGNATDFGDIIGTKRSISSALSGFYGA